MKWIIASLIALVITGCSQQEAPETVRKTFTVYTVNYPLAWMAEQMTADGTAVVFPAMEGDPAFWEPATEQVVEFQNADLILLNGASYAKWIPKFSLPEARLVDTSIVFNDRYIGLVGDTTHAHGPGGAHAHGGMAFTTWLDPQLAALQAASIHAALKIHGVTDAAAYQALLDTLAELDAELEEAFSPFGDRVLLGSHPVYQYLARRYGLNMKSVHWEPDAEPDEVLWRELEDILEAHKASIILWEGTPLPATEARLREAGIQSVVFDPCGNRPASDDYVSVMKQNIRNIRAASGQTDNPVQ